MKKFYQYLFTLCIVFTSFCAIAKTEEIVRNKFDALDFSSTRNVAQLSAQLSTATTDNKEKLELLLLWADKYMSVDTNRFFNGGFPISTNESIQQGKGLCDEYTNIVQDFCKENSIPSIRIEGYVKEENFQNILTFSETNHAWNAVFIDSTWLMVDLFWSTCSYRTSDRQFIKKLNKEYFLSKPIGFIKTHLPADPLFQFSSTVVSVDEFLGKNQKDSTTISTAYSFLDSFNSYLKMNPTAQKLAIARNSYNYNNANPNLLIGTYYNYCVDVINNPKAKKKEIEDAFSYITIASNLVGTSSIEDIQQLREPISQAKTMLKNKISSGQRSAKSK